MIFSWQVSQASEPTNSAPGILGGARIVRFVSSVLQESKTTVSSTAPPAPQNSFSRLPCNHRAILDFDTRASVAKLAQTDYAFLRKIFPVLFLSLRNSKLRRRLACEFFENAVELGQRLKTDREGDFADPLISILQQLARFFDPYASDVIDKVHARHFFEFLAQMVRANIDRFCYSR